VRRPAAAYTSPMPVTADELRDARAAFRAGAARGVLDTGRYRMRYFAWGSGPPVVFVHGMADAGEAFVMVMHRLVGRFTCLAYELPDGRTDGSRLARYRPADYTADLLALLDHLGHARAAVVGSSFGSTIALGAVIAAQDRFTHAVLQNGFACRPLNRFQRLLAQLARFWPGWFADWPEIHGLVMRRIEHATITAAPGEVAEFYRHFSAQTPIAACALRALAIDRCDLRPLLPTVRIPVLLLGGDCDRLVPRSCWDDLAAGLPRAARVEFPGCGHYPQYTHPALMADAIATFLLTDSGVVQNAITII
jgi:pimeloyl-ACP methyl ester carboxylesterase